MTRILLSVIVPIYKCEPYIERCARSLMEQTMVDGIEFLFINDCSPDRSMEVIRDVLCHYPNREQQVRLIDNEKNLGVFETRKRGLAFAKGDYIGWCDSDDWCELTMFRRMYDATQGGNVDIVVCNYLEHGRFIHKQEFVPYNNPREVLANLWRGGVFSGSLWHRIYRRELFMKSMELVVPTNYGEDNYINMYMHFFSSSITYVGEYLYHLNRTNENSLMKVTKMSQEEWKKQRENINNVTRCLYSDNGKEHFHVAMNSWKFLIKEQFRNSFPNMVKYYFTYRECYADVNIYLFTPKGQRVKTFLVYNFFPLFWWFNRVSHK